MKTLYYRRHSTKGGKDNTIGRSGLDFARRQGQLAFVEDIHFSRVFHGPLIRTLQTAYAFAEGLTGGNHRIPELMPVVQEIGTEELFNQITTPEWREATKTNSNLEATIKVHNRTMPEFIRTALGGVEKMFRMMDEDDTAVAFGHSPVIELAAAAPYLAAERTMPKVYYVLGEMEGLIFEEDGIIQVSSKITV